MKKAFRELRQNKYGPIYVCYGNEPFLVQEFLRRLQLQFIPAAEQELAVIRYRTDETSLDVILDEAQTPPFLVSKKMIVVKDHFLFSVTKQTGRCEANVQRLLEYLDQPIEHTILVFLIENEKLDERKKTTKKAKEKGYVIPFTCLTEKELSKWLMHRAREQQCILQEEACNELFKRVGSNLQRSVMELEKLVLFVGKGGTISAEGVETLVPLCLEQNVFKLVEAIAMMQAEEALRIYYDLLKYKEEPIKLLQLIVRQFRHMLYVKSLIQQSYTTQQIASLLCLHPYAVKVTGEQARKFNEQKLAMYLGQLADLDYAIKRGEVSKTLGLELFLLQIGMK